MALTEGRVTKPERRWGCRRSTLNTGRTNLDVRLWPFQTPDWRGINCWQDCQV